MVRVPADPCSVRAPPSRRPKAPLLVPNKAGFATPLTAHQNSSGFGPKCRMMRQSVKKVDNFELLHA